MGQTLQRLAVAVAHVAEDPRSDAELVQLHCHGDGQAFSVLVHRYTGLVQSLCRLNTPCHADAEDACQEVFILLARKAHAIRWTASISNWLHSATRKVCKQLHRSRTRRRGREAKATAVEVGSPLDEMTARELLQVLSESIHKLPAKYREPLLLCTVDGLSREEAATRMGVPATTVKIRLERARQKLTEAMALRGITVSAAILALSVVTPTRAAITVIAQRTLTAIEQLTPAATLAGGSLLGTLSMKIKLGLLGLGVAMAAAIVSVVAAPQPQEKPVAKNATPPQPVKASLDDVDLSKLAPTKEPAYTAKPSYMLLAFDTSMKQRTWIVFENGKLYVDRNGNGDLTDDGEPIAKGNEVTKGRFEYTVGDITTGEVKHTDVKFTRHESGQPGDRPYVSVELATARAGIKGNGPDGRVQYIAGGDISGLSQCAANVKDSCVIHFGQPYIIVSQQPAHAFVGEKGGIRALVGSPGRGKGTFASVVYDGNIPAELQPVAEVTYSAAKAGEKPRTVKYDFSLRTCTIAHDVYFEPSDVGSAEVTFTFPAWKEGKVQPNTEHFTVQAVPKVEVAPLEKISERFIATLPGVANNHMMHRVRFNPAGTHLLCDSYPDGAVQYWDVAKRAEVQRWQFAREPRFNLDFLNAAPDWKSFYYHEKLEKVSLVKHDGKDVRAISYGGQVKRYDLNTGKELEAIPKGEKRGVTGSVLSPCGKYLWLEEIADSILGENAFIGKNSLLNLTTKERMDLGTSMGCLFLPDGKSFIIIDYSTKTAMLQVRRLPDGVIVRKVEIPKAEGQHTLSYSLVTCSPDGKTLALNNASHNLQPETSTLFVDLETLKPVATWIFKVKNTQVFSSAKPGVFSKDGKQYILTEPDNAILIFDLATQKVIRTVPVPKLSWTGTLSPDGKYYATLANPGKVPERRTREEPAAALHPQFRVVLLEWQNPDAKPIELIGPRGFATHVAFNPDGKSLAVAATGGVHLFDLDRIAGMAR